MLESNVLSTIQKQGFQSTEQKNTFAWKSHVDMVVVEDPTREQQEDCANDGFWMDLCDRIGQGPDSNTINLVKNPEHNTGYNGTHIWKAIYDENCVVVDGQPDETCLEERVLYRLLSGLHTSTTVSIARHYYAPSKRKGRDSWQANPSYFMQKFYSENDVHKDTNDSHIRNLHFSYLVLLRALHKYATELYKLDIRTGNVVEDETATVLLKRLLDTSILKSCSGVFAAFDESVLFTASPDPSVTTLQGSSADAATTSIADVHILQENFKGVFHNVSAILDCVQCQRCKLHGKMAMMGYGAALKILLTSSPSLERNEVVALVNTIAKFSTSIKDVRTLTHMYWTEQQQQHQQQQQQQNTENTLSATLSSAASSSEPSPRFFSSMSLDSSELVDQAVGVVAKLGRQKMIDLQREEELVHLALSRNLDLLILAKHYGTDVPRFYQLSTALGNGHAVASANSEPDAIIVGSGLAGMAAALNILDRGGRVVMIEKEHLLGGNSNKASSGINAYRDDNGADALEVFRNDTIRSAGSSARLDLVDVLVSKSASAVEWLQSRTGVDLSLVAQLGGHSAKRTHRPRSGMVGAEVIFGMQKAVKQYEKTGEVTILIDSKVTRLVTEGGRVVGVEYASSKKDNTTEPYKIHAANVVLATGGFASDRSKGSFLEHYRPELLKLPTTAGAFSTGDGVALATALGAGIVDMDKVQVHPTGWVDPLDPDNPSKILAAELMRGVGGLLINDDGNRFCDELGTRAYVTDRMLSHDEGYSRTRQWNVNATIPIFSLVLASSAAEDGMKHVDLYSHKGLLKRLEGLSELAEWMEVPVDKLSETLQKYRSAGDVGEDEFGKKEFRGTPLEDLQNEVFYAGKVTPVLHYCMGGITINANGKVVAENGEEIPGLFAAGEVTGGVHGVNRLAGNSLLECTVFGTVVGQTVPIKKSASLMSEIYKREDDAPSATKDLRSVSLAELQQHSTPEDCWVAIAGVVYDLTEFADEHPAGPDSIHELAGKDGTKSFLAVHSLGILDDFDEERIGSFNETLKEDFLTTNKSVAGTAGDSKSDTLVKPSAASRSGGLWDSLIGR
jgi:flavocytochrome c